MPLEQSAQPPQSRTAYVVERLRADLIAGLLSPGDQLRQSAIARRYGVSATPVREALRILAADGSITYTSHRGATVRDFSPQLAEDLYRTRAEVEGLAAAIAVERMNDDDIAAIYAANSALVKARESNADPATLSLLNKNLHFSIYNKSSPVIIDVLENLWARFKPSVTLWGVPEFSAELNHDHADILEAISLRDSELARQRMREHVMHAYRLRESSDALKAVGTMDPEAAPDTGAPETRRP